MSVRYALNYKRVTYKTVYLELPDIVAFYIDNGIPTALRKADGTPHYSVPLIYDESTKKYINDSFEIAVYLDETYPTPPIFPHNTIALQSLVADACTAHIKSIFTLNLPGVLSQLNSTNRTYYESVIAAGNAFQQNESQVPEKCCGSNSRMVCARLTSGTRGQMDPSCWEI